MYDRLIAKDSIERIDQEIKIISSYDPECPITNADYSGGKYEGSYSEPVSKSGA